jgi:hypothetical protein
MYAKFSLQGLKAALNTVEQSLAALAVAAQLAEASKNETTRIYSRQQIAILITERDTLKREIAKREAVQS